MATFLIAHGAWSAGWVWKKMYPLLQEKGHSLIVPTYTGSGERAHLGSASIGLGSHVQDILMVLQFEDLRDVVLVGHSYGGMVATGVADGAAERIAKLVYLDAFAPQHGQRVFDFYPEGEEERRRASAIDGWKMPPSPLPPDTPSTDIEWMTPRRVPHPLASFQEQLVLQNGEPAMPRSYIYAQRHIPGDPFRRFLDRAKREGWQTFEMDASHSPHVTAPEELADILDRIARS